MTPIEIIIGCLLFEMAQLILWINRMQHLCKQFPSQKTKS